MLYTIERDFRGYSVEGVKAAAFRASLCIPFFEGMQWIRSFYEAESQQARCFYVAASPESLREHASSMVVPLSDVRPVTPIHVLEGGVVRLGEPIHSDPLRDETEREGLWVGQHRLDGRDDLDVQTYVGRITVEERFPLMQAFIDREADELYAVYRAADAETVQACTSRFELSLKHLYPVHEDVPADFVDFRPVMVG